MFRSGLLKYCLVTILISVQVSHTEGSYVLGIAKIFMDVTKLSFKVYEIINEIGEENDISNEDVLLKIDELIESAKSDVLWSMLESSRIERIDNAVVAVHSSMIDLKKILSATETEVARAYETDFIEFYENNNVAMHVRFLPELLTYQSPGQQFQLLSHILASNRCNLTALAVFCDFYLKLVSEGITLHVMYDRLTKGFGPEKVIEDEWRYGLSRIQAELSAAEQSCVDQFWNLTTEDVYASKSAEELSNNNEERYIYNWTDVMFYAPIETHQFHYRKHIDDMLIFQKTDQQNKVVVVGNRNEKIARDFITRSKHIEHALANSDLLVPWRDNTQAATDVGIAVEEHINDLGYLVDAMVVYFVGGDFPEQGMFIDKDSTVVFYTMSGVQLNYCHDWGLVCFFRGGGDIATGAFKVFAYLNKGGARQADLTYTISGAAKSRLGSGFGFVMTVLMIHSAL